MYLRRVRLAEFRNHAGSDLEFGTGINALLGDNGQGKTNVLEAISYLSLTKSFYAASDARVMRFGADGFTVDGVVVDGGGREHSIHVGFDGLTGEKQITVNGVRPERMSEVIGRFPVVILSPDHGAITSGGPAERRKFLDITLSQVSASYLEEMLEYRRVLRHRNQLLGEGRRQGTWSPGALEPWTASLAAHGARLLHRRLAFVREFGPYVGRSYRRLMPEGEEPGIAYSEGAPAGATVEELEQWLLAHYGRRLEEERRRGLTLVGVHRDDLLLTVNGKQVQEYASQGQHKTFLVALKVAEFEYVRERREDPPVMLLDDIFSELDRARATRILELVGELGQCVVTATEETVFHGSVRWDGAHRRFEVRRGTCRKLES